MVLRQIDGESLVQGQDVYGLVEASLCHLIVSKMMIISVVRWPNSLCHYRPIQSRVFVNKLQVSFAIETE